MAIAAGDIATIDEITRLSEYREKGIRMVCEMIRLRLVGWDCNLSTMQNSGYFGSKHFFERQRGHQKYKLSHYARKHAYHSCHKSQNYSTEYTKDQGSFK